MPDEVAEQRCVDMIEPLKCLWIVLFQGVAQAVGDTDPVVHQLPALFDQRHQRAHLDTLRLQRLEVLGMRQQQLQGKLGVRWIVLGTAECEGPAVACQSCRFDREDDEKVVLLQYVDDRRVLPRYHGRLS